MTPERMAELVARWVRFYTRDLPTPIAERRIDEVDADVHDHIAHERAHGTGDRRIALSILSRMVRGLAADTSWRGGHDKQKTAYRSARRGRARHSVHLVGALVGDAVHRRSGLGCVRFRCRRRPPGRNWPHRISWQRGRRATPRTEPPSVLRSRQHSSSSGWSLPLGSSGRRATPPT